MPLKLGACFPSRDIGTDVGAIRAFAEGVEALGYTQLSMYDHVLGADTTNRPDWDFSLFPYTIKDTLHEPLTLLAFLAAVTQRVILQCSVIVVGQRQTALLAKQAAEVDILSNGRLHMGVGVGRFWLEFEGLGADFKSRAKRIEEQMEVMRALWTQRSVNIDTQWHKIIEQGINPLPIQQPIPIWMGGGRADVATRRIARVSDGWTLSPLTVSTPNDEMVTQFAQFQGYMREAGRNPEGFPIEVPIMPLKTAPDQWISDAQAWEALGATHLAVRVEGQGLVPPDEHLEAFRRYKAALDDANLTHQNGG